MNLGRNARALAILKYLLAHRGGRPVSQDCLMGWLWPESDPKRARWSLNSTIYALRKLLGSCLTSLPTSETVLFEGGGYQLSPCVLLSVDTDEFDSRYEEGLQLEKAGRVKEAVAEYEKAADLYRGDYLIEDLYEEWTAIERERLGEVYVDLSRRLALHYMEGGRLREGVRTCYRVLEKDRSDEYAHRLLMDCFVRLGQRGRALRQYGLCEQALRDDYDMPPSPGTQALYASILKDGSFR
jgi:DNA-binding SARP family transcriptional activator